MTVYILNQEFGIVETFQNSQNIHYKRENNNNVLLNSSYLLIQDFCEVRFGPYKINIYKNKAKKTTIPQNPQSRTTKGLGLVRFYDSFLWRWQMDVSCVRPSRGDQTWAAAGWRSWERLVLASQEVQSTGEQNTWEKRSVSSNTVAHCDYSTNISVVSTNTSKHLWLSVSISLPQQKLLQFFMFFYLAGNTLF